MKITDTKMSEENYQYFAQLVLEEIQPALARTILRHKLEETDEALKANPAFYIDLNGNRQASWRYCEDLQHWHMTPEEEAEYIRRRDIVTDCLQLIGKHNRITSMLAWI